MRTSDLNVFMSLSATFISVSICILALFSSAVFPQKLHAFTFSALGSHTHSFVISDKRPFFSLIPLNQNHGKKLLSLALVTGLYFEPLCLLK